MKVLYCDGAFNKQTQPYSWGSVVDENGEDQLGEYMFDDIVIESKHRNVIVCKFEGVQHQNNGAELLAFVVALRLAIYDENIIEIKCDSELIVKWWSKGNFHKERMDPKKVKFIEESIILRKKFEERGGKVTKIRGNENLADLGWHKK